MKSARLLPVCVALAAGLAAGYYWGAGDQQAVSKPRPGFASGQSRAAEAGPHPSSRKKVADAGGADPVSSQVESAVGMSPAALEEALRLAGREAVPGDVAGMLRQRLLLHRLATADGARALRMARELDLKGDGEATALVLSTIAAHDPRAAAAMVSGGSGLSSDPHAALSAISVAAAWARQDPAAAQQWARGLPGGLRLEAWSTVASVVAGSDPAAAAVFTLEMPEGAARAHGCARVADIWARSAPKEALTWIASLPASERFAAAPAALAAFAGSDPAAAAAWLRQQPEQDHLPQNTAALMSTWARSDPAKAALWVAELPSGALQTESMQHLLYQWTASAPEQASTWLQSQPASPARDEAVAMLSLQVSASDPEAAAVWASSISDPARRTAELHRSLSGWLRKDHAAASQWMQEAGLAVP